MVYESNDEVMPLEAEINRVATLSSLLESQDVRQEACQPTTIRT